MKEAFEKILNNHLVARYIDSLDGSYANYVRDVIPQIVYRESKINSSIYGIEASVGKSPNFAEVPWIRIYHRNYSQSASKGIYIAFLFRVNMGGFWISLNQGFNHFKRYGQIPFEDAVEAAEAVSRFYRDKIMSPTEGLSKKIKLGSTYMEGFARGYEACSIYGKYYLKNEMPSTKTLVEDLHRFLDLYNEVIRTFEDEKYEQVVSKIEGQLLLNKCLG